MFGHCRMPLPAMYSAADLTVQSSCAAGENTAIQGFGIAFAKAAADPDDPNALAATIVALLQNRKEASRLGRQGRERAVLQFDWSIHTTPAQFPGRCSRRWLSLG